MFTGIVEEQGSVRSVQQNQSGARLTIDAKQVLEDARLGDSIAVNGVCLTVCAFDKASVQFDVMGETLRTTTLGALKPKARVNLERALKVGARVGGHFVTGHIDGIGHLRQVTRTFQQVALEFEAAREVSSFIAQKGSVAIDGISLTVGEVRDGRFFVYIIPHTLEVTTLGSLRSGDRVNIEVDILARYAAQAQAQSGGSAVTLEFLRENGF